MITVWGHVLTLQKVCVITALCQIFLFIYFILQDVIQSLPAVRLGIKYVSCTSLYRHYNCAGTFSNMTKDVLVVLASQAGIFFMQ